MFNLQPDQKKAKAPDVAFTKEQREVQNSTANNIIVNSCAGSGKSTLLKSIAFQLPPGRRGLYLAFNKAIVKSMEGKLLQTGIYVRFIAWD